MEVYRDETGEILKRFREERISRAECIAALDCALLAAIPDLDPADLPAVQAILLDNSRCLAEIDRMTRRRDVPAPMNQPEPVHGCR